MKGLYLYILILLLLSVSVGYRLLQNEEKPIDRSDEAEVVIEGYLGVTHLVWGGGRRYIVYREEDEDLTLKELIVIEDKMECLASVDLCESLLVADKDIAGRRVSVRGRLEDSRVLVSSINEVDPYQSEFKIGFEDLKVERLSDVIASEVDYGKFTENENFRTRIEETFNEGPNFAGGYVLAVVGCGTNCEHPILLNVEDGKVLSHGLMASHGFDFRDDSRLLVVNLPERLEYIDEGDLFEDVKTKCYILKDDSFVLVKEE